MFDLYDINGSKKIQNVVQGNDIGWENVDVSSTVCTILSSNVMVNKTLKLINVKIKFKTNVATVGGNTLLQFDFSNIRIVDTIEIFGCGIVNGIVLSNLSITKTGVLFTYIGDVQINSTFNINFVINYY